MTAYLNKAPKVGDEDFEDETAEELLDSSTEANGFYRRHWNWALAQATAMMLPIAEKFGQRNVSFSPQNDELVILPQDQINDVCHGILGTLSPRKFYGCTTQEDWRGRLDEDYIKPSSTTYLAQEWAADYIYNAACHELSHQAIISVRQMLQKDHLNRRNNGYHSLSDIAYKCVMERFTKMDRELDFMDIAKFDKNTGKIVIDKKSDVWPMLKALANVYFGLLKDGY